MTHGRSFFHSEYQSLPSHPLPRPSSAAAHGLLPSAASAPGATGRPGSLSEGANSPHAHTASSPQRAAVHRRGAGVCQSRGAGGGARCRGLEACTWAPRVWWLLPRRERAEGAAPAVRGAVGPRPRLESAGEGEGAGSRGGGGRTGRASRRAAGRGRRFRLKSTRISKEAPKCITYSSKTLGASSARWDSLSRLCFAEGPLF